MTISAIPNPDPETITSYITTTFPNTDVVTIEGGSFFSLDPERHFPNFATVVWNDDFDQASNLSRPGFFRLNIGLSRETFEGLVGSVAAPDYTAVDTFLPHPDYARQHYVSIVNPSARTFEEVIIPLLAEAHDRLAAQRARHGK